MLTKTEYNEERHTDTQTQTHRHTDRKTNLATCFWPTRGTKQPWSLSLSPPAVAEGSLCCCLGSCFDPRWWQGLLLSGEMSKYMQKMFFLLNQPNRGDVFYLILAMCTGRRREGERGRDWGRSRELEEPGEDDPVKKRSSEG